VKVLSADSKTKRIALSIKALQASALPKVKGVPQQQPARQKPSLENSLAKLNDRFRSR
jgi:uncharacterized protein